MSQSVKGQCLCGKVKFRAQANGGIGACHCGSCRRWAGGPFLAVECGNDVKFDSTEFIQTFDSSEWAERGFCTHCGSTLFYRLKESQLHIMNVGLLDDVKGLTFDHQVFVDERPEYYEFANKTKEMTGAECFAAFGAE